MVRRRALACADSPRSSKTGVVGGSDIGARERDLEVIAGELVKAHEDGCI